MVSKSLPQRVCENHPVKRLVDRTDIRHWNFQSVCCMEIHAEALSLLT